MKKLIVFILLGVAAVVVIGRIKLSESSAMSLLNEMDQLMLDGKGEEVCGFLHDDVQVSATSNMGGQTSSLEGGRDEFCDYVSKASAGMKLMKGQMQVAISRSNITVERDWKHPWTAHYTYDEQTSIEIPAAQTSMEVETENTMTLVMTLKGVKILKATSEPVAGG